LLIGVEQHFGIAGRGEAMTKALELAPQLHVVVNLAVEDESETPVATAHGLIAGARQIEDGESPKSEAD
jgi:hypothetical protein